jgi:hypothetical protein
MQNLYKLSSRSGRKLVIHIETKNGRRQFTFSAPGRGSIPELAKWNGLTAIRVGSKYFVEHHDLRGLCAAFESALAKYSSAAVPSVRLPKASKHVNGGDYRRVATSS